MKFLLEEEPEDTPQGFQRLALWASRSLTWEGPSLGKVSTSFRMVSQGGTTSKGRFGAWLRNLEVRHVLFIKNKDAEGRRIRKRGVGAWGQAQRGH